MKKYQRIFLSLSAIIVCMLLCTQMALANLVSNPGFETGDFTDWTLTGNPVNNFVDTTAAHFPSNYGASLGEAGADGFLTQTILTPGVAYDLSFWLFNYGGTPNDFSASLGGNILVSLVYAGPFGYTEFTFHNFVAISDTLQFGFRQDANSWFIDDISVTRTSTSVPEPATLLLLGSSLLGLVGLGRKFRN